MQAVTVLQMVSAGLQDLEAGQEKRWAWTQGGTDSVGLLDYLNAAIRDVALQRPDCYSLTEVIHLEPGMVQRIPRKDVHGSTRDAVMLCELIRNMGRDGKTPGLPIMLSNQGVTLAFYNPHNVMTRTYPREIDNYMYDRTTNPNIYLVYPPVPNDAGTNPVFVECTYYAQPPEIKSVTADIGISPGYATALAHHILASVFEVDNEGSGMQKAEYHRKQYQNAMDIKAQVDMRMPKANNSLGA